MSHAAPTVPHNLPAALTRLVGRERDLPEVERHLGRSRLVTLTGVGGIGKTRLAIEAARRVADAFPDGILFVDLAPLSDPALLANTIAAVVGVREEPGRSLSAALVDVCRPRQSLLLLDNCEHMVESCARFTEDLLRACPSMQVLSTSRTALGIVGEVTWVVPALSLPDLDRLAEELKYRGSGAFELLLERLADVRPDFAVSPRNALAIAQICHRLDGIPLALELVAARARSLTLEQIAARLDDPFPLLAGPSSADARHRTLETTLDWSYELLENPEQVVLRRTGVFIGGWTLEAAEAVCSGDGIEPAAVPGLLEGLVNQSLVLAVDQGAEIRYRLLETVREYSLRHLVESGEQAALARRHASYFVAYAQRPAPPSFDYHGRWPDNHFDHARWLEDFEGEHENLRAAFRWSEEHGDGETALLLAASLWFFWFGRGHLAEGRRCIETALVMGRDGPVRAQAGALFGAGLLAWASDQPSAAGAFGAEILSRARRSGARQSEALALGAMALHACVDGDVKRAGDLAAKALPIFRSIEDTFGVAAVLTILGVCAFIRGQLAEVEPLLLEALPLFSATNDVEGIGVLEEMLAKVSLQHGRFLQAEERARRSIEQYQATRDWRGILACIGVLTLAAASLGRPRRAERLLGALEAALEQGAVLNLSNQAVYAQAQALIGETLRPGAVDQARRAARTMRRDDLVAFALADEASDSPQGSGSLAEADQSTVLTPREREVATLVARGFTNRRIADELVITPGTARIHLEHIFRKLDFHSRAELAAFATSHGLRRARGRSSPPPSN